MSLYSGWVKVDIESLKPGNHIRVDKILYYHHMLVIEVVNVRRKRVLVIHYTTPDGVKHAISASDNEIYVMEEEITLDEDIELVVYKDKVTVIAPHKAICRARSKLGEQEYKLFSYNCNHIRTNQTLYYHHMLVIEVIDVRRKRVQVIHYATPGGVKDGMSGSNNRIIEEVVTLDEDLELVVYKDNVKVLAPDEAIDRARSKLDEQEYRLFSNNCESFVNWALTGVDITDQGREAPAKIGAVAAGVGLAAAGIGLALAWFGSRDSKKDKDKETSWQ